MSAMSDGGSVRRVVLTGATGFIGRRLLARLLDAGHFVRAVSRRPRHELDLPEHERLEVVQGNALDPEDLPRILEDMEAAFYLIHSMEGGVGDERAFVERDKQAALNFSRAARDAGIEQIIYLSGLEPEVEISEHLRSRNDVEAYLGEHGVPVTVIRAGFIIGPGSAGFKMLRGITGQMNVLMISEELHHKTQPACASDVIEALATCLEHPERSRGQLYEVGSAEVVEYFDIIREFCAAGGREIEFVEVPWVPHAVAATYIAAVSELPYALVAALAEGLAIDLLITNEALYETFPHIQRTAPARAMEMAWGELC